MNQLKYTLRKGLNPAGDSAGGYLWQLEKVQNELDNLENRKVLRKLKPNEVPEWLNSFVCPVKDDNSLRVCLDPTG